MRLFGKPRMHATRTAGLRCGWRQGIHEKCGVGTLWIDVLGEVEYELCPVPRKYFEDMLKRPDPEVLMNELMRMYL